MPRIKTTPAVRLTLLFLQGYLIVLLVLIVVKFLRVFLSDAPQS